ncbi:hypothetical protein RHDE110596_04480 [Prescottella defluvii]|nr:hypothetical protein [Prescottella defluvii]
MSVMFLDATAALLTGLLNSTFHGSFVPGATGILGSVAEAANMS